MFLVMMKGSLVLYILMCSTIDDILSRDEIDLADVLKSEDLIQEVNGMNANLHDYLKKPEIAQALIGYFWILCVMCSVIEKQDENGDDFDRFKAPYLAAECLCCLPSNCLAELLQNECVIDAVFELMNNKTLLKT